MELINATKMTAGYTMGMEPSGREHVVVVIKGTFAIPEKGGELVLTDEQAPLVMADEYTGEPGFSATLYESEFALQKPRCDILLNGSAYAPGGRAAKQVAVSLRVGPMYKAIEVVGNRVWENGLVSEIIPEPEPFVKMPISYDRAYGGVDQAPDDPEKREAFVDNPVGIGHYPFSGAKALAGKPLPNTQEKGCPVTKPSGAYKPMSFGSIGRNFATRIKYAGTYDQDWIDNVFPFLPSDFDPRYCQCAPEDQQTEYLRGGEAVELVNLTPSGRVAFQLPGGDVPVVFFPRKGEKKETTAVMDTVIIEPDSGRIMLIWRASLPLRKNIFEVAQALIGEKSRAWWRARELGKTYYPSINSLIQEKRAQREDTAE